MRNLNLKLFMDETHCRNFHFTKQDDRRVDSSNIGDFYSLSLSLSPALSTSKEKSLS